jgi:excinuclease ABC subunit B
MKVGERLDQRQLLADLVALQYKRNDRGFCARHLPRARRHHRTLPGALGGPRLAHLLFGDEVESITEFDPLTGQKTDDLKLVKIYANSHYVTPQPDAEQAIKSHQGRAEAAARRTYAAGRLLEAQRLEQRTTLRHGDDGGHRLLRRHRELFALSHRPPPRRAAADAVRISARQRARLRRRKPRHRSADRRHVRGDFRRKATLAEYGFRLPSCMDNRPLRFEEWDAMRPQTVRLRDARRLGAGTDRRRLRRAGHPPHRPHRSAGRHPPRAHAGRRPLGEVRETAREGLSQRSSPC